VAAAALYMHRIRFAANDAPNDWRVSANCVYISKDRSDKANEINVSPSLRKQLPSV
jgi:hypothetical protein